MKPKVAPDDREEGSVRVQFQVQFSRGPKGRRRLREAQSRAANSASPSEDTAPRPREAATGPLPRITRLLVLGHHFEFLVRKGMVKDYAEIARLTGLSRARVTQITNLTLLAPEIQEEILVSLHPHNCINPVTEHLLRQLGMEKPWSQQRISWLRRRPRSGRRATVDAS